MDQWSMLDSNSSKLVVQSYILLCYILLLYHNMKLRAIEEDKPINPCFPHTGTHRLQEHTYTHVHMHTRLVYTYMKNSMLSV